MPTRKSPPIAFLLAAATAMALAAPALVRADTIPAAGQRAADFLINPTNQSVASGSGFVWADQPAGFNFNGTMAAGLANYVYRGGGAAYKTAAESAGTGIIASVGSSNYLGDEAFALTQIAGWQSNPTNNTYYNAINPWFTSLQTYNVGGYTGTAGFLDRLEQVVYSGEVSQPLIYTAYYTRAAYALNTPDKAVFAAKLLDLLGKVNNSSTFPTASLGAGIWGLSVTGFSGTTSNGGGMYANTAASSLPGILAALQDPTFRDFPDTFASNSWGYTEDNAFAIMGLEAANFDNSIAYPYASDITDARMALIGAVNDPTGATDIYTDQSGGQDYYVYAGRTLEALPEPTSLGLLGLGVAGMMIRRRRA